MRGMMIGQFERRSIKKIGCFSIFVLMLILTLPAHGKKPITNAGEALISGMDLGGKHEVIETAVQTVGAGGYGGQALEAGRGA